MFRGHVTRRSLEAGASGIAGSRDLKCVLWSFAAAGMSLILPHSKHSQPQEEYVPREVLLDLAWSHTALEPVTVACTRVLT